MAGPYYFALADETETTFGPEHLVYDMVVFSAEIIGKEGDIPALSVEVANPRRGLLKAGEKRWAWLSWDNGTDVEPLFFGRLVGIPTDLLAEVVVIQYIAKPVDYTEQKQALSETLKVAPYYDQVFIDEKHLNDPDAVLEGYSALYHVGRTDLTVTISDILEGEDGIEVFTAGTYGSTDVFYDSVKVTVGQAPQTKVTMNVSVTWSQSAAGEVPIGFWSFQSYTGDGLLNDLRPGTSIGSGWSIAISSTVTDVSHIESAEIQTLEFHYKNNEKTHENGDVLTIDETKGTLIGPDSFYYLTNYREQVGFFDPQADPQINVPPSVSWTNNYIPLWEIEANIVLQYDAARDRTEHLTFTLSSDLQPIVTDTGDQEPEIIDLNGGDVSSAMGAGTSLETPIGDLSRRSYFATDRGLQSIEYAISVARARLLAQSRAVEISFDCPFERVIDLSCRMNAQIYDDRLPGGQAIGKIIAYSLSVDGDSGVQIGNVTIGCAIGHGGTVEEVAGTPTYVEEGYVELGYQVYAGQTIVLSGGNVGYSPPVDGVNDDGLIFPLTKDQVLISAQIIGTAEEQEDALGDAFPTLLFSGAEHGSILEQEILAARDKIKALDILKEHPVYFELTIRPVNIGDIGSGYDLELTTLAVPKMIDLEAA